MRFLYPLLDYALLIFWMTGITAGLCVLALPFWLLGIPGIDNQYAKGWKMGFTVIGCYPWAWLVNFVVYLVSRSKTEGQTGQQWQTMGVSIALLLFLIAVVRLIQAFKTMARSN